MRLTPAVLSFLGSGLTALVSIIAILVNQRLTKRTLAHQKRALEHQQESLDNQRNMAADDRIWQKRADVYVQILRDYVRWNIEGSKPSVDAEILAEVYAFASIEVRWAAMRWYRNVKYDNIPETKEYAERLAIRIFKELEGGRVGDPHQIGEDIKNDEEYAFMRFVYGESWVGLRPNRNSTANSDGGEFAQ